MFTSTTRIDEDYRLSTASGVIRLLDRYHHVEAAAFRTSDYDAIDMLIDLTLAIEDAPLTTAERMVAWSFIYDDIDWHESWRFVLDSAATKIANYLGGSEGYPY